MKIGIFDSGVGGLSVLKKIKEKVNFADVIYYGDSLNSPYGNKTVEEIQNFSLSIAEFLVDNRVDIIVIACNTATAAALSKLKEKITAIPILGVIEPGAFIAEKMSLNKKIGILSTPLTANSKIYETAIKKINSDSEVFQKGCELLCPLIENGWRNSNSKILKKYLEDLPTDIDTLVLGCTHYPFIENEIKGFRDIKIIDPAEETAVQVLKELNSIIFKNGLQKNIKEKMKIDYFISGDITKFKKIGENFLNEEISNIYQPIIT
ncbi:MAG: glutamate racemase [Cetobacterium sp.]